MRRPSSRFSSRPSECCQVRSILENSLGQAACDLSDLKRMGEPVVKNVAFLRADNLGDSGQAAQRRRVQNAVAVFLGRVSLIFPASVSAVNSETWHGPAPRQLARNFLLLRDLQEIVRSDVDAL